MEDKAFNILSNKKLTVETYPLWASDMDLILTANELDQYIYEDNMKKIANNAENFESLKGMKIRGTDTYYHKSVTTKMIVGDSKAKRYISMNLENEIKLSIDFKNSSAYDIWKLLKKTFTKGNEEMKLQLNEKLENMTYDKSTDIGIFIANMEITFDKLKKLGENVNDERKFNYLYNAIPSDIAQLTNLLGFQNDWNGCCNMLKTSIPRIKFLNTLKIKQEKAKVFNNEVRTNESNSRNKQNRKHSKRNIRCHNCGGFGHISREFLKNGRIHRGVVYDKYGKAHYKEKKIKHQKHADNVEINDQEEESDRYIDIYSNALNMDYNDEREEGQSNCVTTENTENKNNIKNFH